MKLLLFLFPAVVYSDFINDLVNLPTSDSPSSYKEYNKMVSCIEPHQEIIEITINTLEKDENEIYNIGLANKALQIGRNISECLGRDVICEIPKMVLYSLDNADYIGRKLYGDAFHCFVNAQTFELLQTCQRDSHVLGLTNKFEDVTVVNSITKTLFECVAQKMYSTPSCPVDRVVSLYQAGKALIDAAFEFYRWSAKYPVEWEYDAGKYCDN